MTKEDRNKIMAIKILMPELSDCKDEELIDIYNCLYESEEDKNEN